MPSTDENYSMSPERWQQVEQLYHAALEHQQDRRGEFLAEACAGDAALREEVESLLDHAQENSPLDRPAWDGARVGPYQILDKLGSGGMGDVWKARDTRLDRLVAIKRSKARFSERFEREAKAVAALNHPHICTLYDVGPDYLVMEYVEGKPISGPLPLDQALRYAAQIAEALEAAHRKGIIHRDLKPLNILVTKQGVKLLDFGLARRVALQPASEDDQTRTGMVTAEGTLIGTPQYMAPEQVEGGTPDARTDIFAFGCVLYEMLTGKRAFEGKTAGSTIAAILHTEPPAVSTLQPVTPTAIDHVVKTCLAKDPEERWQSARDLRHALLLAGEPAVPVASATRRRWVWPAAAAAVSLAILATWFLARLRPRAVETNPVRFTVALPQGSQNVVGPPAVSPDGQTVAFRVRDASGKIHVWIRRLGSFSAQRLDESAGGAAEGGALFWSPDSRSLAFSDGPTLKRVEISSGSAQLICERCGGGGGSGGGTWNRDGVIIFSNFERLFQVPAMGGAGKRLVIAESIQSGIFQHNSPQFLPNGRHFLYRSTDSRRPEDNGIYLREIGSSEAKLVLRTQGRAMYVQPGYLLFDRDGTIFAQRFDVRSLQIQGEPVFVAQGVGFSVSDNGVLASVSSLPQLSGGQLTWYSRDGQRNAAGIAEGYSGARLSPDQERAVLADWSPSRRELWVMELTRGIRARVNLDPSTVPASKTAWSPDSRRVVFSTSSPGGFQIREIEVATGAARVLHTQQPPMWIQDWSHDNRFLMYHQVDGAGASVETTTFLLPVGGEGKPQTLVKIPGAADGFRFSPDSQWIAYATNDSRQFEVYIATLSAPAERRQVSVGGGVQPVWRKDGKEIFYLTPERKLMAVEVNLGAPPRFGTPKPLFQTNITRDRGAFTGQAYSVTDDGKRLLVLDNVNDPVRGPGEISIVLNWDADLRRNGAAK
jgi:Tol biopolymer transport system component